LGYNAKTHSLGGEAFKEHEEGGGGKRGFEKTPNNPTVHDARGKPANCKRVWLGNY
jgi:hypothetical protein